MSVVGALLIAALGARPSLSRAPLVVASGGPTTPAVRWTPGTRAEVRIRRHTERVKDGRSSGGSASGITAFTFSPSPGGGYSLRFDASDAEVRASDPSARLREALGAHGYGELALTPGGQLESIQLTEELEAALDAALATAPDDPPEVKSMKERSLRFAAQSPMLELWGNSAGIVPAETLTPGVEVVVPSSATNPLTSQPVDGAITYRLEGRVACGPGEAGARCVLLTYRHTYDSVEVAQQAFQFARAVVGEAGQVEGKLELSSEGFVVYEEESTFPRVAYRTRMQRWSGADAWQVTEQVRFEIEPAR